MTAPRAEGTALERAMEALERAVQAWAVAKEAHREAMRGDSYRTIKETQAALDDARRHVDPDDVLAALRSRDADIAAAVSAENEACAAIADDAGWEITAALIRARREGGSDATGE